MSELARIWLRMCCVTESRDYRMKVFSGSNAVTSKDD